MGAKRLGPATTGPGRLMGMENQIEPPVMGGFFLAGVDAGRYGCNIVSVMVAVPFYS